jgi:hypothetical protein
VTRVSTASLAVSACFALSAGAQQLRPGVNTPARRDSLASASLIVMAPRVPSPTIVLGQAGPDRGGRKAGAAGEGGVPVARDSTGPRGPLALRPVIEMAGKVLPPTSAPSRLWRTHRFVLPQGFHR